MSGLRLKWEDYGDSGHVRRTIVGALTLLAWDMGWWELRANGACLGTVHDAGTLTAAQLAAEAACLRLLLEAVVAFEEDVGTDRWLVERGTDDRRTSVVHIWRDGECWAFEVDEAQRLAISLLAAVVKGEK